VELFLVREWQERALVRIDRPNSPEARVLGEASRTAEAIPPVDGSFIGWGSRADAKSFRADGDGARTICYVSKELNCVMKDAALAAMSGEGKNLAWDCLSRLAQAAREMRCSNAACLATAGVECLTATDRVRTS
jgi:hypothetical protein